MSRELQAKIGDTVAAPSIADLGNEEAEKLGFQSKEAFIDEAVNTYLASRRDKRVELAIALYEAEKISLGRAVEIAGIGIEALKDKLEKHGVTRPTGPIDQHADDAAAYRQSRRTD